MFMLGLIPLAKVSMPIPVAEFIAVYIEGNQIPELPPNTKTQYTHPTIIAMSAIDRHRLFQYAFHANVTKLKEHTVCNVGGETSYYHFVYYYYYLFLCLI